MLPQILLFVQLLYFVSAFTSAPPDSAATVRAASKDLTAGRSRLFLGRDIAFASPILPTKQPLVQPTNGINGDTLSRAWQSLGKEAAFATPVFPKEKPLTIPTNETGVNLILPDFDVLFSRIAEISPLARQILEGRDMGGFRDLDITPDLTIWKTVEKNEKRLVHEIDRIDNFEGTHTPLIRMRSRLKGPERDRGDRFSRLLTDQEFRMQWDPNCAEIYEMYLADDISDIDMVMERKFGKCQKFGLGYCRTKKNVVSPREQLTLCGLQEFPGGASIVWGIELEDDQNHLFPPGERLIRSRSHIFSNAIIPTGDNTFDCEYVLCLEIGGFPEWLARPVLVTICRDLFKYAQKYYMHDDDD